MRGYTRHQLKQDRFAEATKETFSWAVEHRQKLVTGGIVAGVAIIVVLGIWYGLSYQSQKADGALSLALRTYQAPLRPPNAPADPVMLSFTSANERAKVANAEFRKVADSYGYTTSGKIARYFEGLTLRDMGDLPGAERVLKDVGGSKDLQSLAKMALAGVYRDTGREKDAIALYNDLIAHPTSAVAKSTAQLELADVYATSQPVEARRIYEQVRKDEPTSPAAEIAGGKLAALK